MTRLNRALYGRLTHRGSSGLGPVICLPCFDLEQFRPGKIRAVLLHWRRSVGRRPRFDPHRLRSILWGGLLTWKIWNRIIRGKAARFRMVFRPPGLDFLFAPHQLSQLVCRLLCSRLGHNLGTISFSVLPLSALGSIPELASQLFRPSQKSAPEEFLRRGLNLFFCTF